MLRAGFTIVNGIFWTPETDSGGRIASRADHGPDADLRVEAGRLVEDGPIREHALVGPGAEGVSTRELKTGPACTLQKTRGRAIHYRLYGGAVHVRRRLAGGFK